MGVVIVEDNICLKDVAKLIVWAVIGGIPWITIFDKNGFCKKNKSELQKAVLSEQLNFRDSKVTTQDIALHSSNYRQNNLGKGSSIGNVVLLSPADGQFQLAAITADLAQHYVNQRLSLTDFNVARIDSIVQDHFGFPDPDLVMKFGDVDSLLGYLPWHLRLTEIVSAPTHQGITYASFRELLVFYANTQQRCGK